MKFWYRICGHVHGWCRLEKGCNPVDKHGEPVEYYRCAMLVIRHPLTDELPHTANLSKPRRSR